MNEKDDDIQLKRSDSISKILKEEAYIIIKGKKIKPFYNKEDDVPQELIGIIEKAVLEMHEQDGKDDSLYEMDPDSAEAQDLKDEEEEETQKD